MRLTDSGPFETGDLWRQPLTDGKILIFIKWYDRKADKLSVIGSMAIDREMPFLSIRPLVISKLKELDLLTETRWS